MNKLTPNSLMPLEQYARERVAFRARVLEHKKPRKVALGPHVTLLFEDRLTMQYQVQEMLRTERIFEAEGIQEELDAYNPLIPDGTNLKATMMIEYADERDRREALGRLMGIENKVWARVGELEHVWSIADEDLERTDENKTSAVHFLRFELDKDMIEAVRKGASLSFGVDHERYKATVSPLPQASRDALAADLT